MTTNQGSGPGARGRTAGIIAVGLLAGGVAAGAIGVVAASASPTASPTASASEGASSRAPDGSRQSTPVRDDEKSVTATQAATLKAAALKAVPGGTVYRIEADAGDGTYEAHMTKADGSRVTVKFDAKLAVTEVEDGMGSGDPGGHGGRGHGPDGGADQRGGASGEGSAGA
jgi:hypothetical protein